MTIRVIRRHRDIVLVSVAALLVCAAGCSINPATGQRQLSLIGEQQEIAIGRQEAEKAIASYGRYPDDEIQSYVSELGNELAAVSERPDLPWTFAVVDDPVVNAFALPGGYIFITRGILAHFNSKAELASVMGHEIGHVTARHSVEQMSTAQLANLGLGVAMIASDDIAQYAGLAAQGLQLLFLKFSRDDERQSDDLGLRYMTRSGYDPNEMPKVFNTLDRVSAAHGGGGIPVWASTHPSPDRRAERITEQIGGLPPEKQSGSVERDDYLRRLQGMMFGENPREGYTIANRFYHPDLAFQLQFPPEWRVLNTRRAVGAISPAKDGVIVLTLASGDSPSDAARAFFEQGGIEQGKLWNRRFFNFRTVATEEQPNTVQGLVGFLEHGGRLYQLLSYTPSDKWSQYQRPAQQSLASFKALNQRRYLDVQPARIEIVELPKAMTIAEFQRRYPSNAELIDLAILNGVAEDELMQRGRLVKRVVGGELPDG
jgi:predicted Zn-dependent protease